MKKIIATIAILAITFCPGICADHCKGTTKKGEPCKSAILMKDGYCRMHSPASEHCTFIKKNGERCRMVVGKEQQYCRFHAKN
jgi:hypothetical protein